MINKRFIALCFIIILLSSLYIIFKPNRWQSYYKDKLKQPARQFVIDALALLPKSDESRIALDLGSGVGHETLLLLKEGFHVIAIDNQQQALNIMLSRPELKPYLPYVKTLTTAFENIDFSLLPNVDLVIASFSLPFCSPNQFNRLFADITQKLKPNGYFIGNFFDPGFNVFKDYDRKKMTFHTKIEVIKLLNKFKILSFKENITSATELGKTDHTYEILAQKINSRI